MKVYPSARFLTVLLAGTALAVPCFSARAQENEQQEDAAVALELRYVNELLRAGLSDYASQVIQDTVKRYPASGPQMKAMETQVLLQQGKLDEVLGRIKAMPNQGSVDVWALRLTVANYYYAASRYADADAVYKDFFKQIGKPGKEMIRLYREAAYNYVQLLLLAQREKEALQAFGYLLSVPMEEAMARRAKSEYATLLVKVAEDEQGEPRKARLAQAEKVVDELLWTQDLWFGSAVVLKANIAMQRGNLAKAQDMVGNYMKVLTDIHEALKEQDPNGEYGYLRMSPMSSCRYLLGVMLQKAADKEMAKGKTADDEKIKSLFLGERMAGGKRNGNGAFNHFINVFIRYPESQWAVDAGKRSEQIRAMIKTRYSAELNTPVTEAQMKNVRQQQFAGARMLFTENKFDKAAESYEKILEAFPGAPESVAALGDLAICYIEMSDKTPAMQTYADTVAGHLAERFGSNKALATVAGDQLRRIAERYGENNKPALKDAVLTLFFLHCPEHPFAASAATAEAEKAFAAKQYDQALKLYGTLASRYPGQPWQFAAFSRMAQVYDARNDYSNQLATLSTYIAALGKREKPGQEMAAALFRQADAMRRQAADQVRAAGSDPAARSAAQAAAGNIYKQAAVAFVKLATVIEKPRNPYEASGEERTKNEELRENALFLAGVCLGQIQGSKPEEHALFRKQAIAAFEKTVAQFPKGKLAPKALLQVGSIHTVQGNTDVAQTVLARLRKEYPESQEAKNSVPMLAAALIDMDMRGEGVAMYKKMFEPGGSYTDGQFLAAGQALLAARENELALQAFDKCLALAAKGTPVQMEASLGLARVQLALKKAEDATKTLDAFLAAHGRTTLALDANLLLIDVVAAAIESELDDAKRNKLMGRAKDAFTFLKQQRSSKEDQAGYDLQAGRLLVGKMRAEITLGKTEAAQESRGQAITAFQTMIMRLDPTVPALAALLEEAYHEALPLMVEMKRFEDVAEDAQKYVDTFPQGRYLTDVRNWLSRAKIEAGSTPK